MKLKCPFCQARGIPVGKKLRGLKPFECECCHRWMRDSWWWIPVLFVATFASPILLIVALFQGPY
jgi:hypothetical protein